MLIYEEWDVNIFMFAPAINRLQQMEYKDHFAHLAISEAIAIGEQGMFAKRNIEPFQLLLTVKQSDAICYSSLPTAFKQTFMFLQKMTFTLSTTGITKNIEYQTETLLFYLIYLKKNRIDEQPYATWLNRPLSAMYYFDRKVIEQSQNYELLINYVAEHNHLQQLTQYLFGCLRSVCPRGLQLLMDTKQPIYQHFKDSYEWSYHFVNNRSFGYTSEFTMIPFFDMMNHSSRNDNVQQILSLSLNPTKQELAQIVSQYIHKDNSEADNNEQSESDNEDQNQGIKYKSNQQQIMELHYHVVAIQHITKGQQIFIRYGSRNNKFLLEAYGFVEQFNPYDSFSVYLGKDTIFTDQVRSDSAQMFKFKRNQFCLDFFLAAKKLSYQKYYKKQAKKAKVIWSIPKDKPFQQYFLKHLHFQMKRDAPRCHIFSNLPGGNEMTLFQRQQQSLYSQQLTYISLLLSCSQSKPLESSLHNSFFHWPKQLLQYHSLLSKL